MIRLEGLAGKRFLILGLGRSGKAAYRSLEASGAAVHCWDDDSQVREGAAGDGYSILDPTSPGVCAGFHAAVVSPGIPHLYPKQSRSVAAAVRAGIPLDNDIGLYFRSIRSRQRRDAPAKVIAVTGSNGKSTTSALIAHVLRASGQDAALAGNIGNPVLELAPSCNLIVLEISSYQAELAQSLDPDIAVLLNFSADHLGRHGGIGGYFAAKRRLFEGKSLVGAAIGTEEPEGEFLAAHIQGRIGPLQIWRVSRNAELPELFNGAAWRSGCLTEFRLGSKIRSAQADAPSLSGEHNAQNASAAYAACRLMGLAGDEIEEAMKTFEGLPHRMQILGTFRGVQCVNDSKATNANSAEMALRSFRNIRWIAGGIAKEGGLSSLKPAFKNVRKAYLIGQSADDFAEELGSLEHEICGNLANAVKRALDDATQGDTVLLSPAAASFDQYSNFEERGQEFINEVLTQTDNS